MRTLSIGKSTSSSKLISYTQLPGRDTLQKIARLYAKAFAGPPWNEYKICEGKIHYFGREQSELTSCTICNTPLQIAYPEEQTVDYITRELTKSEGTLITCEDEKGNVLAAGWGFACTTNELQNKYNSPQMKNKVADAMEKTAAKVERVFYVSEVMVDEVMRRQGIATKITNLLVEKGQSLHLPVAMRTNKDSPMVRIADPLKMSRIIEPNEDSENPDRVLYIKI